MFPFYANLPAAKEIAVQAATHQFDYTLGVTPSMFVSSTNCWLKSGQAYLITVDTKANHGLADTISITALGATVVYELDKAGNGVVAGNVQVDISGDTTAAQVAARLRTAILANQTTLSVTDNTDGTLTVQHNGKTLSMTESGAATVAEASLIPTAGDGSMYLPANTPMFINSLFGPRLAAIRDTADGKASLVPVIFI